MTCAQAFCLHFVLGSVLLVVVMGTGCGDGDGNMEGRIPDSGGRPGVMGPDASGEGGGGSSSDSGGGGGPDASPPGDANGGIDGGSNGGNGGNGGSPDGGSMDASNGNDGGDMDTGNGQDGGSMDAGGGETDGGGNGTGNDDSGTGNTASTWTEVWPSFNGSCNSGGCHDDMFPAGGLDMSTKQAAYDNLVGVDASSTSDCAGSGLFRVEAGNADMSLLVRKLEEKAGNGNTCGDGMPVSGGALPRAQIDAVRSWIDAGAENN